MFRSGFQRCPIDGAALERLVDDPIVGSTLADRYVIEECIGEGAMGRVYRARHARVSRRFAIKVLFGDHSADPKMQERFAREAEAASRLDHPNVMSVVDFGEGETGLLYLVMDYVEGTSLAEIVHRNGPLAPERATTIVRQLARGLAHAHERGLVHRDFKTDNVIVTEDGGEESPRIVDFGLAVMFQAGEERGRLTTEGMVVGTPAYMAPEQSTSEPVDHRTDLFSLGVVYYELLAGVLPFGGTPMAIARQNLNTDPPPIAERVPGLEIPPRLERVAHVLMTKTPAERYQSAREVVLALADDPDGAARALDAAPTEDMPPQSPRRRAERLSGAFDATGERRRHGRRRWAIGSALAAVGAAVAALVLGPVLGAGGTGDRAALAGDAGGPGRVAAAAPRAAAQEPAPPPTPAAAADAGAAAGPERGTAAAGERESARPGGEDPDGRPGSSAAGDRDPERRREPAHDRGTEAEPDQRRPRLVSRQQLTMRYRTVGAQLQGLEAPRLQETYLKLPYTEALRDDAVRRTMYRALAKLEARIRRARAARDP